MKQVANVLKRARAKLIKYGWIRGSFGYAGVGYCLVGAICQSTSSSALTYKATILVMSSLPVGYRNLIVYNDMRGRTKRQVIALLTKTIKKLERELL